MLVGPSQQSIVIRASMLRAPARPGLGLAFEARVRGAHDRLAQIIEAVRRMLGDLVGQRNAGESGLKMQDEVRLVLRQL